MHFMTALDLDDRGIIEVCPQCGQKNRVGFEKLANSTRCGRCKASLPQLAAPVALDDPAQFRQVVSFAPRVLVDFFADWCGPCKMMAPQLEKVASMAAGRLVVVKIDTEAVPSLAQQYEITALPTLVLFSHGAEAARIQGARSAADILRFVEQGP